MCVWDGCCAKVRIGDIAIDDGDGDDGDDDLKRPRATAIEQTK